MGVVNTIRRMSDGKLVGEIVGATPVANAPLGNRPWPQQCPVKFSCPDFYA